MHITELIACITGFIFFKNLKNSFLKYFPYYLLFIIIAESTGFILKTAELKTASKIWFNYLVIPVEFLFFYWIFYRSFAGTKYRVLPVVFSFFYIACWMTDIFLLSDMTFWFYSFSYTIGNLLLLILIFRYFFNLTQSDDILYFKNNMLFWISGGLLLFYLGTFPYYGLLNTIAYTQKEIHSIYRYVVIVLNALMYLMFTFSFIWGKPNTKYSSS